jgi:hypothetical protein
MKQILKWVLIPTQSIMTLLKPEKEKTKSTLKNQSEYNEYFFTI